MARALGRVRGRIYNPLSTDVTNENDNNTDGNDPTDGSNDVSNNDNDNIMEGDNNNSNNNNNSNSSSNNNNNHRSVLQGARSALQQRLRERQERRRQQYRRIGNNNSDDNTSTADDDNNDSPLEKTTDKSSISKDVDGKNDSKKIDNEDGEEGLDKEEKIVDGITVVILDPMQTRFQVPVSPKWTVSELKASSEKVHKVPPMQQRLIYRGKLLSDNETLEQSNITEDGIIIHLFPKPRVVVTSGSGNNNETGTVGTEDDDSGDDDEGNGAHVPEIILDADEAERRSSILVLGSPYFVEAQNNVKLLAFLLLVITSIELLNLFAIFMGVPADQEADFSGNTNGAYDDSIWGPTNYDDNNGDSKDFGNNSTANGLNPNGSEMGEEFIPWTFADNFDFIISAFGFYVALLGIQATNENTLRLAKRYMYGTFVVGVAWMIFNYIITAQALQTQEEEYEEEFGRKFGHHSSAPTLSPSSNQTIYNNNTSSGSGSSSEDEFPYDHYGDEVYDTEDYYAQSIQYMILPGMVWLLCCIRAWQFHYLLQDAEMEAQQRIRSELDLHNNYIQRGQNGNEENDNNNDIENGSNNSNELQGQQQQPRQMQSHPPPLPMIT